MFKRFITDLTVGLIVIALFGLILNGCNPPRQKCAHITINGDVCQTESAEGNVYCLFHKQQIQQARKINQSLRRLDEAARKVEKAIEKYESNTCFHANCDRPIYDWASCLCAIHWATK